MQIRPEYTEPFDFPGNGIGCLLVHGFTGAPGEMRPLGEYLNSKGFTVKGIRLPGHGTTPDHMLQTKWDDWYSEVVKGYTSLAKQCRRIFIIGLSMGGTLTLNLAGEIPINGGIIPICAPIFLMNKRAYLTPYLHYFVRYTSKKGSGPKKYESFWYDTYPTKCVASLVQALPKVKEKLKNINVPAFIIQSQLDKTVNPNSAKYIYDNLNSTDKELKWLYNSGHIATLDIEREQVFIWIENFIRRIGGKQ